jgi:hypothetical protein
MKPGLLMKPTTGDAREDMAHLIGEHHYLFFVHHMYRFQCLSFMVVDGKGVSNSALGYVMGWVWRH